MYFNLFSSFLKPGRAVGLLGLLLGLDACQAITIEPVPNPNGAELTDVLHNATRNQVSQLAVGTFAAMRTGYSTSPGNGTSSYESYCKVAGTLGREVYVLNQSEPRWVTELSGQNGVLDNGAFYNGYYLAFSNTRETATVWQRAALNTAALTAAEKLGVQGASNTIVAFELLHVLNMQGKNGIRLDVQDFLHPGPFVGYEAGLAEIRRLLELAQTQLQGAGPTFAFAVPAGFAGFDTPVGFLRFNRAVLARVALYQHDWTGALAALQASYLDLAGNLGRGPVFTWGISPDVLNPLYQPLNSTVAVVANNSFVADAEPGDARLAKVARRDQAYSVSGISGRYDVNLYPTNLTPVSIIRNEELVLLYAECQLQTGQLAEAVRALNLVRTQSGQLPPYAGPVTPAALLDELLQQRRYSLFYEGHRWLDLRRYGRLSQLPLDVPSQSIFEAMPRPLAETNWQ